ncbi:unnamed protein product [Prorocentrum cordatum]|uniref:MmyB-like transcription regulator ligand binding domain-containing protein n=1 Tax=Prorocentrum cordatum TaxID=2364126 RepID=A0ABN9WN68_9DINO|nr:unnamed protein product [Polarella glacialis]
MLARTLGRVYMEHRGPEVIEAWRERLQGGAAHGPAPDCGVGPSPPELEHLLVNEVRFTHASVSRRFRHGPHRGKEIVSLAAALESGDATVDDVPLVCVRLADKTYSLFNRRLYGLREYASRRPPGEDVRVPAWVFKADPVTAKFVIAFTSQCDGAKAFLRGE